jgi:hypothetical protein
MIRIVTDNDFNGHILDGVLRVNPAFDAVRVQDTGMADVSDGEVLAWAAGNDRVVATHDRRALVGLAWARVAAGERMPGVFAAEQLAPIARVIDDLLLIDADSDHADWVNCAEFLPW